MATTTVAAQGSAQKLEDDPQLPLDSQSNLVYTLTRIFRQLAQIVNPIVAWVANWTNITVDNGSNYTRLNVNAPKPTGLAELSINSSGPGQSMGIVGRVGNPNGLPRWQILLGDGNAETGGNTGSNFVIQRYSDSGSFIANSMTITRATGLVTFAEATAGVEIKGTNGLNVSGGPGSFAGPVAFAGRADFQNFWSAGYRIRQYASNWYWRWNESNGTLGWVTTSGEVITISGGGNITGQGFTCSYLTSTGGMNAMGQSACDSLFTRTVIYANPQNGMQYSPGWFDTGSGTYYCCIAFGVPNYGNLNMRFMHVSGSWVGLDVTSSDGKSIRWSAQTGTMQADAFTPWSDRRLKAELEPIADARAKVAQLVGYTYTAAETFNYDGKPIRHAGLIAQDALPVLPEAVSLEMAPGDVEKRAEPDDETPGRRYTLDYNAIVALLVNDNNDMAARIASLESRVAALEPA